MYVIYSHTHTITQVYMRTRNTYACLHTYIYINAKICACAQACLYVCLFQYVWMYVYVLHICIWTASACMHACTYTHMWIWVDPVLKNPNLQNTPYFRTKEPKISWGSCRTTARQMRALKPLRGFAKNRHRTRAVFKNRRNTGAVAPHRHTNSFAQILRTRMCGKEL